MIINIKFYISDARPCELITAKFGIHSARARHGNGAHAHCMRPVAAWRGAALRLIDIHCPYARYANYNQT